MRNQLDDEMQGLSRRDGRIRRFGIPIAAAAAVAAAAIGGYAVLGGNNNGVAPAGTNTNTATKPPKPTPTGEPTQVQVTRQPQQLANPNQAYRRCIAIVRRDTGSSTQGLSGKAAYDNGKGITVVVANQTDAYTCNVKPDSAVSNPRPLDSAVSPEAFAVARNVTANVIPNDPGDMVWGGGALPDGVSTITYVFPDGHSEPALTRDGFWVMQYFSFEPLREDQSKRIKVLLDGTAGPRELTLEWGTHTCNQVSHGC
jgi:hypothetical protein